MAKRCPQHRGRLPCPGRCVSGRTKMSAAHEVACGRGHAVVAALRSPGRSWSMPRSIGRRTAEPDLCGHADITRTVWWAATRPSKVGGAVAERVETAGDQLGDGIGTAGEDDRVGHRPYRPEAKQAPAVLNAQGGSPQRKGRGGEPRCSSPTAGRTRTGSPVRRSGVPPNRHRNAAAWKRARHRRPHVHDQQ